MLNGLSVVVMATRAEREAQEKRGTNKRLRNKEGGVRVVIKKSKTHEPETNVTTKTGLKKETG